MSACAMPDQSAAGTQGRTATRHPSMLQFCCLNLPFLLNLYQLHRTKIATKRSTGILTFHARTLEGSKLLTLLLSVYSALKRVILYSYIITVTIPIMLSIHQVRPLISTCGRFLSAGWHLHFSAVLSIFS